MPYAIKSIGISYPAYSGFSSRLQNQCFKKKRQYNSEHNRPETLSCSVPVIGVRALRNNEKEAVAGEYKVHHRDQLKPTHDPRSFPTAMFKHSLIEMLSIKQAAKVGEKA